MQVAGANGACATVQPQPQTYPGQNEIQPQLYYPTGPSNGGMQQMYYNNNQYNMGAPKNGESLTPGMYSYPQMVGTELPANGHQNMNVYNGQPGAQN